MGGKRNLASHLLRLVPDKVAGRAYFEPFLGAGSMFFALGPVHATLSDANRHLIGCYRAIRKDPEGVARLLAMHRRLNSEAHFYRTRELYNEGGGPAVQAARFIYLNATCYNGIFRVNKKGRFNVPYGDKERPQIPRGRALGRVSSALKLAGLRACSYETLLAGVQRNAFVYLDPPYPPLNGTSYFTHYTMDRFSSEDQEQLAESVEKLHKKGALFLMTNADTEQIRQLYKGFRLLPFSVTRFVSCKAERYRVTELVITNYEVDR